MFHRQLACRARHDFFFYYILLTNDLHAVDALPPWDGAPALPHERAMHRLQSHMKRLIRHIVSHPVGSVHQGLLQDRIHAFQIAERDFAAASDARQAASDALMDAFYTRNCDNIDAILNDVISPFSRY